MAELEAQMQATGQDQGFEPLLALTLWPHRSLSLNGFRTMMLLAALGLAIPVIPVIGAKGIWIVVLFLLADLALLYGLMKLTYRSGRVREELTLWPDRLRVVRSEPNGRQRVWEANPHWVRISLHDTRQVPNYLVLSSAGRDIELGAFLTSEERVALASTLRAALTEAATAPGVPR